MRGAASCLGSLRVVLRAADLRTARYVHDARSPPRVAFGAVFSSSSRSLVALSLRCAVAADPATAKRGVGTACAGLPFARSPGRACCQPGFRHARHPCRRRFSDAIHDGGFVAEWELRTGLPFVGFASQWRRGKVRSVTRQMQAGRASRRKKKV